MENIVGKGENAGSQHFLLFQQSFHSKLLTLYHTTPIFNDPEKEAFWKHYGKRRKCW